MSIGPIPCHRHRHRGFTLIELLIAIALMAVLAVMGWRGLDSVLSTRERIVHRSDALGSLSVAFAQMQEDLLRAWPVRLLDPQTPPVGFVVLQPGGPPALALLRESLLVGGPPQVQRVVYRLRDGVFERGFAPWVPTAMLAAGEQAANEGAAQAVAVAMSTMTWQPLLTGVTGLQIRAWLPGQAWLPAEALANRQTGAGQQAMPTGVELVLDSDGSGRIVRVFTVRD